MEPFEEDAAAQFAALTIAVRAILDALLPTADRDNASAALLEGGLHDLDRLALPGLEPGEQDRVLEGARARFTDLVLSLSRSNGADSD